MQLQRQLERRQLRFLIGLQRIGRLLLEVGDDLLELLPEGGHCNY